MNNNDSEQSGFSGSVIPYRQQILQHLLENKNGLNIEELTHYLKISRAAVQQHFSILEKEGLIKKHRRIKTLGRPSMNYVLTNEGLAHFPKRYSLISNLILEQLNHDLTPEQRKVFMQKLGKKLAEKYKTLVAGKNHTERAEILVDLMQDLGFEARMKHHLENHGVEIHAYNCIYHDVAQQFQEVCTLDETFLSELMNKKIKMHRCMAKGDDVCCFKSNAEKNGTVTL
ncbi:MAG: ArsR family transcriptional regulator [Methylococcaceae bacterium]|nr:ArsR family transcriptional regulator [Methylococcaceae bacterium]